MQHRGVQVVDLDAVFECFATQLVSRAVNGAALTPPQDRITHGTNRITGSRKQDTIPVIAEKLAASDLAH